MTYADFLARKRRVVTDAGVTVEPGAIHPSLFGFQRAITAWALRKGRAAIWADTGLGKTRMEVEWARLTGERALIFAPLGVTAQTVAEAARIGVDVRYAHDESEATGPITITNYERLDRFDHRAYGAVVLDESSILKAFSGVTKKALVKAFAATPYRLACSATPAPNDIEELCNHADFLGVMSPSEMRSTFFIADSRGEFMRYRLKRHAHGAFYRWLSSWAMAVRLPSDLGFDDEGFVLPGLEVHDAVVASDYVPEDRLFIDRLKGVTETAQVRRGTLADRVAAAVAIVAQEPDEQWLVWCGLNDEADAVTAAVPGAVNVAGSDSADDKAARLGAFADGSLRALVTKPAIGGYGLNFQRCARMVFVGLGYSFEDYYQCLRRCYRFGQERVVQAWVVVSDAEAEIVATVRDKEAQHARLAAGLLANMVDHERAELFAGTSAGDTYEPRAPVTVPQWMRSAG